jgi:hypothetical protein
MINMNSSKFKKRWAKERDKGIYLYTVKGIIYIIIASHIGAIIGNCIVKIPLFTNLHWSIEYFIGLIILCSVSIFIGIYSWNVNEKKYIQLNPEK